MQIVQVGLFTLAIFQAITVGQAKKVQIDAGISSLQNRIQNLRPIQKPTTDLSFDQRSNADIKDARSDRGLLKASQIKIEPWDGKTPQKIQKWIVAKSMKSVNVIDAKPVGKKPPRKKIPQKIISPPKQEEKKKPEEVIVESPLYEELKQLLHAQPAQDPSQNKVESVCELLETEEEKANAPTCVKRLMSNFKYDWILCTNEETIDVAFNQIRYPIDLITLTVRNPIEIANRIKLLKALGDNEMFWGMLNNRCFIKRNAQGDVAVVYLRRRVTESFQSYFSGQVLRLESPFDKIMHNKADLYKAIEDDNDSFIHDTKKDTATNIIDELGQYSSIMATTEPKIDDSIKFGPKHPPPSRMHPFSLILIWRLTTAYQIAYKISKMISSCIGFSGSLSEMLHFEDPINVLISPSTEGFCQIKNCEVAWQGYLSFRNETPENLIKGTSPGTYEPHDKLSALYNHRKVDNEMLASLKLPPCSASAMMDIRYSPLTLVSQFFLYFNDSFDQESFETKEIYDKVRNWTLRFWDLNLAQKFEEFYQASALNYPGDQAEIKRILEAIILQLAEAVSHVLVFDNESISNSKFKAQYGLHSWRSIRGYWQCYQNQLKAQMQGDQVQFVAMDICTKQMPNSEGSQNGARVIDMLETAKRTLAQFELSNVNR